MNILIFLTVFLLPFTISLPLSAKETISKKSEEEKKETTQNSEPQQKLSKKSFKTLEHRLDAKSMTYSSMPNEDTLKNNNSPNPGNPVP